MKITTFQAKDMRDALQEVKTRLGADAVILSTRSVREQSKSGLPTGRTLIEVTACPAKKTGTPASGSTGERETTREEALSANRMSIVVADPPSAPSVAAPQPEPVEQTSTAVQALASDLSTIRNTLKTLEERVAIGIPATLEGNHELGGMDVQAKRSYSYLLMHGVEEPIARKLAQMVHADRDQDGSPRDLAASLQKLLEFRDPLDDLSGRIIALVGPTGVGKTTTLAKIAAELLLNRQRSVGMITLDTFRVGAVAQLETYAKLLQVRLIVARSTADVRAGMQSLSRCDHILVDTVGSSPYNRRQVNSTGGLLPVMGDERHVLLCMSGNVRETEQQAIYRRFSSLQPTGLIFTKLDETMTYGGILNVALRARLPLTFYTDGQRVPENLGWLSAATMAQWFEQPHVPADE